MSPEQAAALAALPTAELMSAAAQERDRLWGRRITYSPKVFIPLTKACRNKCGYCTFAQPPGRLAKLYLEPDEILNIATAGAELGCHEALFTLGERPELAYPQAAAWLGERGYTSTIDYLAQMCALVGERTGLLAHSNGGALSGGEMRLLREHTASQGCMVEVVREGLAAHRGSPDKTPQRRLGTLDAAGEAAIPFTTGILVGIGESETDRIEALVAIAQSGSRYGHIQEVIVQNFQPKAHTAMASWPPADPEAHLRAVALARLILPPNIHIQAPPNLAADLAAVLAAGIDDWGGVSPLTPDHVNPERPWPHLGSLEAATQAAGFTLAPRLAIHPAWAAEPHRWLARGVASRVLAASDGEGLARDHPWVSGGDVPPPRIIPASGTSRGGQRRARGPVSEVLRSVIDGETPDAEGLVTLFSARGPEVAEVAEVADELRKEAVGDDVTWVANRNINYTNICTFGCRFCAFSRGPRSKGLRGDPYLLSLDQIAARVVEAEAAGATEVCLQGGIHPSFDGEYYLDVIAAVRSASPGIHIHGFSALEIWEGARRLSDTLPSYLRRLAQAGLASLPGTAAEILDDTVRSQLCPDKIDSDTWLEVHRQAHLAGLRSNVTIMFGAVETPRSWATHLIRTAALQAETGGFTEFVPLPFVHMASPIFLQGRARRGPTFREAVLMHAVGRIAYRDSIDNIQASWPKMGAGALAQLLEGGCNDLGGTLMDENISRAAGASHGQALGRADFEAVTAPLGRKLVRRDTFYRRMDVARV